MSNKCNGRHFEFQYGHQDETLKIPIFGSNRPVVHKFCTQRYVDMMSSIMDKFEMSDKCNGCHFEFQYGRIVLTPSANAGGHP